MWDPSQAGEAKVPLASSFSSEERDHQACRARSPAPCNIRRVASAILAVLGAFALGFGAGKAQNGLPAHAGLMAHAGPPAWPELLVPLAVDSVGGSVAAHATPHGAAPSPSEGSEHGASPLHGGGSVAYGGGNASAAGGHGGAHGGGEDGEAAEAEAEEEEEEEEEEEGEEEAAEAEEPMEAAEEGEDDDDDEEEGRVRAKKGRKKKRGKA